MRMRPTLAARSDDRAGNGQRGSDQQARGDSELRGDPSQSKSRIGEHGIRREAADLVQAPYCRQHSYTAIQQLKAATPANVLLTAWRRQSAGVPRMSVKRAR